MTIDEVNKKYKIPIEILKGYENSEYCNSVYKIKGKWIYDDQDLENLSLLITLRRIGFHENEVKKYMIMSFQGEDTESQRLKMLQKKRKELLNEIHFWEKKLSCLDYLRYEIMENNKEGAK